MPVEERIAKARAENPGGSNRLIAKVAGVDEKTVRKAPADQSAPADRRIGLDGKSYPARREISEEPGDDDQTIWRRGVIFRAEEAISHAAFDDWSGFLVDRQVATAARRAADAWEKLAAYLERRANVEK